MLAIEPLPMASVATPSTVAPVANTLPNRTVVASDWNSSSTENFSTVLVEPPFELYLIYKVIGEPLVASAASALNTSAFTWLPL